LAVNFCHIFVVDLRKLSELHISVIGMIKSRRIGWAWHVECMGRRGMHLKFWWESQNERDLGVVGG
jgi:hypothetical protein